MLMTCDVVFVDQDVYLKTFIKKKKLLLKLKSTNPTKKFFA